ncbi:hypothetical protein KIN20_030069 [Parelaphostrongylus tenuis]|uniref:Uncharacterized protein n=1 Tax=Parelaphostrongylus tenuis TaxID=148309 RepID=A0AAD5R3F4_PARTN|nr:hypothetical protein KIN20_030069 [Parelaphostrongylus tenuis]
MTGRAEQAVSAAINCMLDQEPAVSGGRVEQGVSVDVSTEGKVDCLPEKQYRQPSTPCWTRSTLPGPPGGEE